MNENLQSQMQTLSTQIVEVSNSPAPVEEVEATTERRSVRMFFAEEVQATVLEKFESGQWFVEDRDFHHNFVFDGTSASGSHFVIKLMTPYRQPHQPDGLHDYVLEVRVDDRRAMRFEWDAEEGRPSKLFLSRSRAWIDDIKSWNFQKPPRPHSKPALQAAE